MKRLVTIANLGFVFGLGFEMASQVIWMMFDIIRELANLPIG